MYEDFKVTDRWTGEDLHCEWKGTVVAIATRHADATDIRFAVNGRPVWIAMPNLAWVEQKRAPERIIARHASGDRIDNSRPLCPFPQVARWTGKGSTREYANFVCSGPARKL